MVNQLEQLKYPIGKYQYEGEYDEATRQGYLDSIRTLPEKLKALTAHLSEEELQKQYRPGGWTIRQVVHHVVDSHLNSYIRFKWGLTEETPTIKVYNEAAWAELPDTKHTPISVSLQLLEALHTRWIILLENFTVEDWRREVVHPEMGKTISLNEFLVLYAWHSEHHLEHVKIALKN